MPIAARELGGLHNLTRSRVVSGTRVVAMGIITTTDIRWLRGELLGTDAGIDGE
jgi:hypothetical protein